MGCPYTRPPGTACSSGAGVSVTCEQAPAEGNQGTHSLVLSDKLLTKLL